jgi:hypothetical protein
MIELRNMREVADGAAAAAREKQPFEKVAADMSLDEKSQKYGGSLRPFSRAERCGPMIQGGRVCLAESRRAFSRRSASARRSIFSSWIEKIPPSAAVKFEDHREILRKELYNLMTAGAEATARSEIAIEAGKALKIEDPLLKKQYDQRMARTMGKCRAIEWMFKIDVSPASAPAAVPVRAHQQDEVREARGRRRHHRPGHGQPDRPDARVRRRQARRGGEGSAQPPLQREQRHRRPAQGGRQEVQDKYGVELDPETEVIATIGSKEGFSHLCLAMLGPGDTVVVGDPAFPIHIYAVAMAGANVIRVPLGNDQAFLDRIEKVIAGLYPTPKLLILNYPHNPTSMTIEPGSGTRRSRCAGGTA